MDSQSSGNYTPPSPSEIDKTIHEPARLLIVANLYVVEKADFTFLMGQTQLTWGNLSSHLAKLENAGYVEVEKTFVGKRPYTMLHLTQSGRAAFETYRQQMLEVLSSTEIC
ncbi:MAG: transcriptional regulator [Caldilineaceae bacterium]|nr:transcriptional regulator [Caldilineaceae bacterium]